MTAKPMGTREVHSHSSVTGPYRFAGYRDGKWQEHHCLHSHEGGGRGHLHPDCGPAYFLGRPRPKFTVRPNGPQLPYVERPPEASTFRVIVVDAYTDGHASAGISPERFAAERDAFMAETRNLTVAVVADGFDLTPIYELHDGEGNLKAGGR